MSKHTRRQTPASRDNRRAAVKAKRSGNDEVSAWDGGYGLSVGSYSSNEEPRRAKHVKHPLGFTAPKEEA